MPPPPPKRRATVLVTDSRDFSAQQSRPRTGRSSASSYSLGSSNSSPAAGPYRHVHHIAVDSVLRGTSEIPSGQTRGNSLSYLHRSCCPVSLTGRPAPSRPVNPRRIVNQCQLLPSRSTKISEKLCHRYARTCLGRTRVEGRVRIGEPGRQHTAPWSAVAPGS